MALKLTAEQQSNLFYVENWPEPFRSQYSEVSKHDWRNGPKESRRLRAQIAVDRINYMLETGE